MPAGTVAVMVPSLVVEVWFVHTSRSVYWFAGGIPTALALVVICWLLDPVLNSATADRR